MLNKQVIAQHEVIEMAYDRKREPTLKKKKMIDLQINQK